MVSRRFVISLAALVGAQVALTAALFSRLPERVAMHWNMRGEVDRYGSRWELALLLPLITAGMAGLFVVLPSVGPLSENMEKFRRTYGWLCGVIVGAMGLIQAALLLHAIGQPIRVDRVILVIVGLMLAVIGNSLEKVRRNFWVGIRTPWTLVDDRVWERTHHAGRWLFVAWGLAIAAAGAVVPGVAAMVVTLAGGAGVVVWCFGYSFYVYRRVGRGEGGI